MRVVVLALALLALGSSSSGPKIAYLQGSTLVVADRVVARHVLGAVRWSGDGKLLSVGGQVIGGPRVAESDLVWAPSGETAAFGTNRGGVYIWTPRGGRKLVVPDGWGATTLAWSQDGSLAIGRAVCIGACGKPTHAEIWVWRAGSMRRLVGPLRGDFQPLPFAWSRGRVLWWRYPNAASAAADGVTLYANQNRISFGVNTTPPRIGREHRAIWQLLPTRRQLTHPPAGRTDEFPQLLPDGSIVFVRTRSVSKPLELYGIGTVELLRRGKLTSIGTASKADNYYGHYAWAGLVAVTP